MKRFAILDFSFAIWELFPNRCDSISYASGLANISAGTNVERSRVFLPRPLGGEGRGEGVRPGNNRRIITIQAWLLFATFSLLAVATTAAPLRVTTWNIEPNLAAGTNGVSADYRKNLILETVDTLKTLHPDVILLQGVPDWESCNAIVKELKPAKYNVAAWSSFRDPQTGALSPRQTAILSKTRAYISWSDAWKNNGVAAAPGGFAFAAVRANGKNVGLFSVQLGDNSLLGEEGRSEAQQSARAESARQLLGQIDSLKSWTTNRLTALTVGGAFNTSRDESALAQEKTLPQLEAAGLSNAFGELSLSKRITLPGGSRHTDATADYIFIRRAKPVAPPDVIPTALTEHYPVTCDLDLDPPAPTSPAPTPAPAPVQVAETPAPKPAVAQTNAATNIPPVTPAVATATTSAEISNEWRVAGIAAGGILVLLLAMMWKLSRRQPVEPAKPAMLNSKAGASTPALPERIVMAPRPTDTAGSAADHPPVVHIEAPDAAQARLWQRRAEEAERRAEQAKALAHRGVMAHLSAWLKSKLVQRLASDRARLLETQKAAALKMRVVDERLAKIENQLQDRNRVYEKRIEELENELSQAREENRELIRAKIAQVRAEMERARAEAARGEGGDMP